MQYSKFQETVVKIRHLELFGEASHAKMSPPYRMELARKMQEKAKSAKKAGVMALFYPDAQEETNLVLILRKTYKGVHSAQVGFPGGKYETTDHSLEVTALRETKEEIGVPEDQIELLKPLSPLYIPPSNYLVHPFIGLLHEPPKFKKQDEEVEAILEVYLKEFLSDNSIIKTVVPTSYDVKVEVPAFKLNGHVVWGATAMMLGEIKDLLNEVFRET